MTQSRSSPEDLLALRRLVDDYGRMVDTRNGDAFASLFTPAGVLAVYEPNESEPSLTLTGYDELKTVTDLVAAWDTTFHLMANFTCDVDGDRAEGFTYGLSLHLRESDGRGVDTFMVMQYRDTYERVDGDWRIARRDVLRQWTEYNAGERARLVG